MKSNIARLVLATLTSQPEKIALADETTTLTRHELLTRVEKQAECFLSQQLSAGDFIVVLCDRGLTFWIELLAGWTIGLKVICVEASIGDDHANSILEKTDVKFIAHDGVLCPAGFAHLKTIPSYDSAERDERSTRDIFQGLPFSQDESMPELAGLIYTSGTTGLPKAVPLSHHALSMNALATATRLRLQPSDRLLLATPFRFISSISHFIVTVMSGATLVGTERKLLIKDLIEVLAEHDITAFGGSPFHMQFIAMAGQDRLPALRWAMSSGDHLRVQIIEDLHKSFDSLELHVVYGMAELGGRFCSLSPDRLTDKAGSVGLPLPGLEFTVRDSEGELCPPGVTGNIYVSGLLEFEGYFENPEANDKVLGPHGFRNGDVGHIDEDGFLFLSGRSDAVFKRSGLKVSSQIITDALIQLPEVSDAYVAGEEDAMEGRVPVAYIAWRMAPMEDGSLTALLRKSLPTNHIPRKYVTLSEIPRTGSGKVDRRRLAALVSSLNS